MTTKQTTVATPDQRKSLSKQSQACLTMTVMKTQFKMSNVMREPAFYVCENKGPDQLSGSRTAEHRLSFRYIDTCNTNTLLYESEISNLGQSALSVSVLVGDLRHRFSHDVAQICLIFFFKKTL